MIANTELIAGAPPERPLIRDYQREGPHWPRISRAATSGGRRLTWWRRWRRLGQVWARIHARPSLDSLHWLLAGSSQDLLFWSLQFGSQVVLARLGFIGWPGWPSSSSSPGWSGRASSTDSAGQKDEGEAETETRAEEQEEEREARGSEREQMGGGEITIAIARELNAKQPRHYLQLFLAPLFHCQPLPVHARDRPRGQPDHYLACGPLRGARRLKTASWHPSQPLFGLRTN